ncbi:hypothetical protein BCR32DRAFT_270378 [Anaeromyces robustus]|uniref:G-protein coupled receptors family 1 profile domain-containing protein n=1 Tax=Anaeromyces robustus TaxID=1754192 RepID=A0A1Y1WX27_9FUNG|nr:hypothetical protein BCR32DRAFT_270378 [Anaeromyces robustus]|eukprot:ORX77888.1 hypothetical protein BCR32DRAFT_270378 [Anaeromyces robustus]
MYSLLSSQTFSRIDLYEKIIFSYITNDFFPWVCFILLLNRKNWKKPIVLILIFHWFFRATGDVLRAVSELFYKPETVPLNNFIIMEGSDDLTNIQWPYTNERWMVGNAIAHVFWFTGEIIGDWYLYIRTKAATTNRLKNRIVLGFCLAFNLSKLFAMYTYFAYYPFDLNMIKDGKYFNGLLNFNILWWSTVVGYHLIGFGYDFTVIYALRTELFDKLKEYKTFKKNSFVDKFKQISELRIFTTMIATLLFLPIIVPIIIIYIKETKNKHVDGVCKDPDPLRQVPLSLCYNLIYIDQILLRNYINGPHNNRNYKNN